MVGRTIGSYKVTERIGHGGMGIVYRARHVTVDQIVAIKALPAEWAQYPEMRERFINEAKSQAILSHPNIVNLYSFFEQDGLSYLVMEYVDGDTVERVIEKTGIIPPEQSIRICKQILSGLAYAHGKGIIHRDIKPSNIIVTADGIAKITDFGIAKIATDFQRTQTGIKVGTLSYVSPEYIKGNALTHLTDIYALGVTLFQMVSGKLPFTGDSEYQLMKALMEYEPPSPVDLNPDVPRHLEQAILKAIRKDPAERFQNAAEFAAALAGPNSTSRESGPTVLSDMDRQKTATVTVERSASGSRRGLFIAGGVFLVLIIVGIVYFIYGDRNRLPVATDLPPSGTPAAPIERPVDVSKGTAAGNTANDVIAEEKIIKVETSAIEQMFPKSEVEKRGESTASQRKRTDVTKSLTSGRSGSPGNRKKPMESKVPSIQPKETDVMQPHFLTPESGRSAPTSDQKEPMVSIAPTTVDVSVQTPQTTTVQVEVNLPKTEKTPRSAGEKQPKETKGAAGWIIRK